MSEERIRELRSTEAFLDYCATNGVSLAEARRQISFTILALEIEQSSPALTWEDFYEELWKRFNEREEQTR